VTDKAPALLVASAAEIGAARWNALANPQGLADCILSRVMNSLPRWNNWLRLAKNAGSRASLG
jgi:hypothetical protein